nr:protein-tyrosine phosphatase family protein [Endozoicomonas sp.]
MDSKPVNSSTPKNDHHLSNDKANKESIHLNEKITIDGKEHKVSKPVIWGLKLCRALLSVFGLFKKAENYLKNLIDENRSTPQQKTLSERSITKTKDGKGVTSKRLPKDNIEFKKLIPSTFSSLKELPESLNKAFPEKAEDETLINGYQKLAKQSRNLKISSSNSLNSKENTSEEANQFRKTAVPKYKDIHCHKDYCPAPGNTYHATKIAMPHGDFIAAQGPVTATVDNYIRLINSNDAPVSLALIGEGDLRYKNDKEKNLSRIGPKEIGQPQKIPEQKDNNGNVIAKAFEIELVESFDIADLDFRIDKFKIDGKTHFRVNEMGWKDHTAGNPARLVAVALIVEKLRQHPEVADRAEQPIVVNCNAGVGRTGTFITADDTVREYLEQGGEYSQDFDQKILYARERRNLFVQTNGQYSTLTALHQNLATIAEPIIHALDIRKEPKSQEILKNTQSLNDDNISLISASSYIPEESTDSSAYASVQGTKLSRLFTTLNKAKIENGKLNIESDIKGKLEKFPIDKLRGLITSGSQNSLTKNITDPAIKDHALTLISKVYGKKKAVNYIKQQNEDLQKAKNKIEQEYKEKTGATHNTIKTAALQEINRQITLQQPPQTPRRDTIETENPYVNFPVRNSRLSSGDNSNSTGKLSRQDHTTATQKAQRVAKKKPPTPAKKVTANTVMNKINAQTYQNRDQLNTDLNSIRSEEELNTLKAEFSKFKNRASPNDTQAWEQAIQHISKLLGGMGTPGA